MESLALLQVKDDELVRGLCEEALTLAAAFSPHAIVLMLEACIKLRVVNKPLGQALIVQATKFPILELSPTERTQLAHAVKLWTLQEGQDMPEGAVCCQPEPAGPLPN